MLPLAPDREGRKVSIIPWRWVGGTQHLRLLRSLSVIVTGFIGILSLSHAESEDRRIGERAVGRVSYVSSGMVYIGAGKSSGITAGDTVVIRHAGIGRLLFVVSAASSSSSVCPATVKPGEVTAGDTVYVARSLTAMAATGQTSPGTLSTNLLQAKSVASFATPSSGGKTPVPSPTVRGRLAMQYAGSGQLGGTMDYSEPSVLLRLDATKLFDSGFSFSLYGRTGYDASALFSRYGTGSHVKTRLYQASFGYHSDSWFGFDAGRVTSRFAGGLGQLDGLQLYATSGNWTIGVLAGAQPDYSTSGIDVTQQRGAIFLNFVSPGEMFDRKEFTVSYGRQLHEGRLDRDFLSFQGSAQFGRLLSLYENSEVDLHSLQNGVKTGAFSLTNTFFSLTCFPADWLTVTAGYDAARNLFLFDSMKSMADTLLDRELRQGFRGNISLRLPARFMLLLNGTFRSKAGTTRESKTYGATLRNFNIGGSTIGASVSYSRINGTYTDGNDYTGDVDWWPTDWLSVTARLDRFESTLLFGGDTIATTTLSGSFNLRFSRSWYGLLSVDQVWDPTRKSQRVYAELGFLF